MKFQVLAVKILTYWKEWQSPTGIFLHLITVIELGEVEVSYDVILAIFRRLLSGGIYCIKQIIGIFMCAKKMNV